MPHYQVFIFGLDFEIMQIHVLGVAFLNDHICDMAPSCGAKSDYALWNKCVLCACPLTNSV